MKTYDIIAFGELLIDFVQKEDGSYIPNVGGAPANLICVPAKYGLTTAFIGKIGTDRFGKAALKALERFHVDTSGVLQDPSVFTTLAFVTTNEKGQPLYEFVRKPGSDTQFKKEELPISMLQNTKILHFSSLSLTNTPSREATFEAIRIARESGAMISFDVNYQLEAWHDKKEAKKQILQAIKDADLVNLTEAELHFLGICPMDLLHQYSSHFILINMGLNGCRYVGRDGEGYVQGVKQMQVVDTRGAEDIFTGAALYRYLELNIPIKQLTSLDLENILHFANEKASLSTTKYGTISSNFVL